MIPGKLIFKNGIFVKIISEKGITPQKDFGFYCFSLENGGLTVFLFCDKMYQ